MNKLLALFCASAMLAFTTSCGDGPTKEMPYNQGIHIIPAPVSLVQNDGAFTLSKSTKIYAQHPRQRPWPNSSPQR